MYGVSLNELIEKLNTPGAIQTEAQFEDVLFAINQRLSVGDPISSMQENLEVLRQGLDHPNLKLRTFSLDHLARCSSSNSGRSFLKDTGLLITIVNTIGDDNISLASKAATISSKAGTLVLEDAECANILKQFMPLDSSIVDISSIGLRVLDMVVDIALGSHEQFQYCWDQGWLGPVFTVVRSTEPGVAPDPMHLLNIMQLLEKLVGKEPGIVQRLSSNQGEAGRVVKWIIEAARSWNTQAGAGSADPAVATLAGPEVLRLLQLLLCPLPDTARRAAEDIAIIRQHNIEPIVLEILQSEERDEIKQEAALGVIGAIGCSLAGMEWLLQSPSLLQELRDAFMSSLPLLRIGSIYWLSFMLQYCQDEDMSEELFIHHLSTGQDVGTSPSALLRLVNNLKNHSQKELRGQTLRALEALADLKWGRRELMLCPGLVSWLLKRGTEMEKTGMEWKFSIIQRLVKHPEECAGLIGDEEYIKLNVYVREGIFFKESNVTVAISDRAA